MAAKTSPPPPSMDHGYPVDKLRRCSATTKKARQCQMPPIAGITLCALHSGLARTKWNRDFGSSRALAEFKRGQKVSSVTP